MLVLNADLWKDHCIVKVRSSSKAKWGKPDAALITQCVLSQIKEYLTEVEKRNEKMILIIDLSKGSFPPWMQTISIARFFVSLKSLLISSLAFTLIYTITKDQKTWINRILMIYTPARPVHMVSTKDEIRKWINEYRESTKMVTA
jgi:hypothetical protein